jgi:superfamily II DNA or RNA helicase
MQPRHYQTKLISDILAEFKKGNKHVMVQAPTGAGKTFIFSLIAYKSQQKGKKVLILSDRTELLTQTGGSLQRLGIVPYSIQAGIKRVNNNFNVYNAMSQTFKNRIAKEYWQQFLATIDLIIIDEAHKQEFNYLFESGFVNNTHLIGFSATPDRSGKMRQLALDYDKLIIGPKVSTLIDEGHLVTDHLYSFDPPDLTGVAIDAMKGDYNSTQMFHKFNTPQLRGGVVKQYIKHIPDTKGIVFCVNTRHAINTCLDFQAKGIDARFVVSNRNKPNKDKVKSDTDLARYNDHLELYEFYQENYRLSGDRKTILNQHKNGKFPLLVNIDIFTTGYDDPSLESVIVNRATQRRTLWYQMIGRGSRTFEGKNHFNILDFGGNAGRLGEYSEVQEWSLWHERKKGKGLPPLKICGQNSKGVPIKSTSHILNGCNRPILASLSLCPFCGFKYPATKAELKEAELALMSKGVKFNSFREMTTQELLIFRKIKQYKQAWLWRELYRRNGEEAIREAAKIERWNNATTQRAINFMKRRT